jgi:hypothetical protein
VLDDVMSETVVLDDGVTDEFEGGDRGLIEVLLQYLPLVVEENHENLSGRITIDLAKIKTEHVPNK